MVERKVVLMNRDEYYNLEEEKNSRLLIQIFLSKLIV